MREHAPVLAKARLVLVTAALTSVAWLVVGALQAGGGRISAPAVVVPSARPSASLPATPALVVPVQGVTPSQLIDDFTQARDGGTRAHDALDIPAPAGTPVLAASDGTVEKLFLSRQGGNTVYVRSPDGRTMAYYAHLLAYAPGLYEGRRVKTGEVIGSVGATGNADPATPHLHFALLHTAPGRPWHEGEAFDPYPLLRALP